MTAEERAEAEKETLTKNRCDLCFLAGFYEGFSAAKKKAEEIAKSLQMKEHEDRTCKGCGGFCCACELCECCSRNSAGTAADRIAKMEPNK